MYYNDRWQVPANLQFVVWMRLFSSTDKKEVMVAVGGVIGFGPVNDVHTFDGLTWRNDQGPML